MDVNRSWTDWIISKKKVFWKLISASNNIFSIGLFLTVLGAFAVILLPSYRSTVESLRGNAPKITTKQKLLFKTPQQRKASNSATITYDHGPFNTENFHQSRPVDKNSLPVRIIIPSLSIDLLITPSNIVNNAWEISETSASYGMGSAVPGTNGNTVIFAHARKGMFGDLRQIKTNDKVYVLTRKDWYEYKVIQTKIVFPDEIEVIKPTAQETLTLYTCSGFADTKRLIVQGKRSVIN